MQGIRAVVMSCSTKQLALMQSRTTDPGSNQGWEMPSAEAVEKQLYRLADTLEQYTKFSNFNQRVTNVVTEWRNLQVCLDNLVLYAYAALWQVVLHLTCIATYAI